MMKELSLAAFVLLAAASPLVPNAAQASGQTEIERGRERYIAVGCAGCHGYEGQGGAGPKIGPEPLPLRVFDAFVRKPVADMPPYSNKVLSTEELRLIHVFLASRAARVELPAGSVGRD